MTTLVSRTAKDRIRNVPGPDRPLRSGKKRKTISGMACPRCGAEAIYRYGRTKAGHTRYLCQVCRRQFTLNAPVWLSAAERPACPACGLPMHVYMRQRTLTRFRCSDYPNCRTFLKRTGKEG